MKLPGDYGRHKSQGTIKYLLIGLTAVTAVLVGGLLLAGMANPAQAKKTDAVKTLAQQDGQVENAQENAQEKKEQASGPVSGTENKMKEIEQLYSENRLTAGDLDFWDMYPPKDPEFVTEEELQAEEAKKAEENLTTRERYEKRELEQSEEQNLPEDPADDGKHTKLTYSDGTEEWVVMNPYLEKHTYDFTNLTKKGEQMSYLPDGKKKSFLGVDLSKFNGEIDFARLKEAGVEFVILKVGARGYGSGQIMADENYVKNIEAASQAGMKIGLYFFSQAITGDEAVEEANYVLSSIGDYKITYPIAYDMEYIANDKARIDNLTVNQKTDIAKAFLDTIQKAGHKPMIYGTKEWLLKEIDLTKLTAYDIWLSQQSDTPDYPYQFQMWQYSVNGKIGGISGDVDYNISFVDYSEK